jgi:hypothetical protein
MAKKKDEEPIKPQPAPNAGDAVASGLFGGSLFQPNFLQRIGSSFSDAVSRGIAQPPPPAMMAGSAGVNPLVASNIPSLPSMGPLIRTSRFNSPESSPAAPQPARQPYNDGLFAATAGLPSFDVTKTQTPFSSYSASAPQQISSALSMPVQGQAQPTTQPILPSGTTGQASQPMAGFARISDWSQNPLVQAAKATGDISAIAKATEQARNQGRNAFTPKDISGVSLAAMKASEPNAGFGGSRTPAEQQALLAQVRANGARLAAQQSETMRNFAESRGPRFAPAAAPQGRYGQALTGLFPQSTEAIAQRVERNAPILSATGFGAMARSVGQNPSLRGPLAQTPSLFANRSGFESGFGGPQPASSMMASSAITDERRRRIFERV